PTLTASLQAECLTAARQAQPCRGQTRHGNPQPQTASPTGSPTHGNSSRSPRSSMHYAGPTSRRSWRRSTRSIRGWVAYYRTVVPSRAFNNLPTYLWKLTYKWACWSHPNKPKRWITRRYYGKFNKFRDDRWVFGDRDTGAYMPKPAWTDIVRHTLVKGRASVDDPDLTEYWTQRPRKVKPPLDSYTVRLLTRQDSRCTLCGENLLNPAQPPQSPEDWERWYLRVTRKAIKADYLVHHTAASGTTPRDDRTHLVHATCARSGTHTQPAKRNTALQPAI